MEGFYRIVDFEKRYLTSDTKRTKGWLSWIKIIVKHDGRGYKRIAKMELRDTVFTAFILMLEVSVNMPTRGELRDEGGPLTAEDLADMTSFSESTFEIGFDTLVHPKIRWLEFVGKPWGFTEKSGDSQKNLGIHRNSHCRLEKRRVEKRRVEESRVEETTQDPHACAPVRNVNGGKPPADLAVAAVEEGTIFSRSVDIREGWNNFAKSFPEEQQLSTMRILTQKRMMGFKKHIETEGFDLALILVKIRESDHLKGLNGWKVDFDWIFCPKKEGVDNWLKIMEGKYDNRKITPPKSARELREERAIQESMEMAAEADRRDRELAKEGEGEENEQD